MRQASEEMELKIFCSKKAPVLQIADQTNFSSHSGEEYKTSISITKTKYLQKICSTKTLKTQTRLQES